MKRELIHFFCGISIVLLLVTAGCVAPPGATPYSPGGSPGSNGNPGEAASEITTSPTPNYVTEETPFGTTTTSVPSGFHTLPALTQNPEDVACLISLTDHTFLYNKTAISFNVVNPPMYVTFLILNPRNLTGTKVLHNRAQENADTVSYTYPDPSTWFSVTVRDKSTGKIFLQDGYLNGNPDSINRTLKVLNVGDMLIELEGNRDVKAEVGVWVKPSGNLNATFDMNSTRCVNFVKPS